MLPQSAGNDDWSDDDQEYIEELITEGDFDEEPSEGYELDSEWTADGDDGVDLGPAEYDDQDD